MALGLGNAFVGDRVPHHLARRLVERNEVPGMLGRVGDWFDVAVLAGANTLRRVTADGGGDEHAIAPDDRARHRHPADRRLPCDAFAVGDVPFHGRGLTVGHARRLVPPELRPVLGRQGGAGEHDSERCEKPAHDYFPSTREYVTGCPPPCVRANPVTLSPSTWNVIVIG